MELFYDAIPHEAQLRAELHSASTTFSDRRLLLANRAYCWIPSIALYLPGTDSGWLLHAALSLVMV